MVAALLFVGYGGFGAALPRPTPQQAAWQTMEIGALVHFNMFTYGSQTGSAPSLFQPSKLDTDQWVQSFVDLGVKEAVLTAKHGSGFTLWPSNATMPDGRRYNYRSLTTTPAVARPSPYPTPRMQCRLFFLERGARGRGGRVHQVV